MKYFAILCSLLGFNSLAGEAIIPFVQANANVTYTLNISNVSATDAEVEVVLFNKDGTTYTGGYATDNGGALNSPFTIPANQTIWIWVNSPQGTTIASTFRGYGVIKSTEVSGATGKAFIVAHGIYDGSNASRWASIPINNGLPF